MLVSLWADLSFYGVFYFDFDFDFDPIFFLAFNFYKLFSISDKGLYFNPFED